jgi:hypothetical protein
MPDPRGNTPQNDSPGVGKKPDTVERVVYAIVLSVMAIVPLLAFLFSFGNVGDLGVHLGIDRRIAYLTGPGVDLTATGMIVAATWLSYRGRTERELLRVHVLSVICALMMFGLNCGPAIYIRRFQLAAFNGVGPFLLMAMGFVGPLLLRQLAEARQPPAAVGTGIGGADEPAVPTARRRYEVPTARADGGRGADAAPTAVPTKVPSAPESADDDGADDSADSTAGADVIDFTTAADGIRRSLPEWVELALPLYRQHIRDTGDKPNAPQLAALLDAAGHGAPGASRARDVRRETEKAATKPERAAAVSR